jgi:hypothetical protein
MSDNQQDDLSKKMNVLIALSLRQLAGDKDFAGVSKRKKGIGDLAQYLNRMGLDTKDIADILGYPVTSVRTLLTPKRRK